MSSILGANTEWFSYDIFKKYINICALVSMCISVFMMVALTLERHFAICSPHAYRIHIRTTARYKHLAMYIVPVTILAIFFNIPMLLNVVAVRWNTNSFYLTNWQLLYQNYNYFLQKDIVIGNSILLSVAEFAEKPIVCENQPVPSSSK